MVWYNPATWFTQEGQDNSKPTEDDVIIDARGEMSFGGLGPYQWELREQAYRQKNSKGYQKYLAMDDAPPPFLKKDELAIWCKETGVGYSYQDVQNYYNGKSKTLVPQYDYRAIENDALAEEVVGEDVFDNKGVYRGPDGGVDGIQTVDDKNKDLLPLWLQDGVELSMEAEEAVPVSSYTAQGNRLAGTEGIVMADVRTPAERSADQPASQTPGEEKGWWDKFIGFFTSDEKAPEQATVAQPVVPQEPKPEKTGEEKGLWDKFIGLFTSDEKAPEQATVAQPVVPQESKPEKTGEEKGLWDKFIGLFTSDEKAPEQVASAQPVGKANQPMRSASDRPTIQQYGQTKTNAPALAGNVEVVKGVTVDEMRQSGKFTEYEIQEIYSRAQTKARAVMANPDLSSALKAAGQEVIVTQNDLGVTRSQIIELGKMSRE